MLYKNISISYTDTGSGKCIVFLHGFLENKSMWEDLAQEFSQKYRVICIDLLGHGDTEPLGYVQTMEDQADMVYHVLKQLRIKKVVFAGHSMGGYVALAFAEMFSEMVNGIALINSTSRADNDERKKNRDRAIQAVKKDHSTFVRLSIANLFHEDNRERLSEQIEDVKQEALKTPLQSIVASLEGMKIRKDREVLLHFAPYPMVLILGKGDPVLPFDETVDQIDGTAIQLVTFEGGHMSTLENPEELKETLRKFFKK